MFKKLHLQLTVFCTFATSVILIAMTAVILFLLRADASRESFSSFEKNVASMISYLENQPVISHQWLLELEKNAHLEVSLFDGNAPLFFNSLHHSDQKLRLFEQAEKQAAQEYRIPSADVLGKRRLTENAVFSLNADKDYYASVAAIPKEENTFRVIALYCLDKERQALRRQVLLFSAAVLTAIFFLAVFSWFFTRQVLLPVEENRRRQTEFVAAASHELRAPLTVILSSLTAMKNAPAQKQAQFAANIQEESQRMNRLIGDMLILANADSGNWSFCPAKIEPDTFLLEIYERYLPRVREKNIRLDLSLPETAVAVQTWDPDRITQVLEILLDNALAYTPAGGTVHLELGQKREKIEIRVADNGPGIPDSQKSRVFQRFYRLDQAHHDKSHFGLGLCIAQEIIKMHQGQIYVEDTPGGGACFVILL